MFSGAMAPPPTPDVLTPPPRKEAPPVPAVPVDEDVHNPFAGDMAPDLAAATAVAALGERDPFAEALRNQAPVDEAQVPEGVTLEDEVLP
jgi:hypothetical protein